MRNADLIGKHAFTAIVLPSGYIIGRADYGERGYTPMKDRAFETYAEAKAAAKAMNDERGMTEREALEIVFNTM